ncbi:MAG: GNAT family N-acetyltransferase [Anaerolineales bacterium]|jgi:ribosomal protein S18 acetylase RimI-like enzyme
MNQAPTAAPGSAAVIEPATWRDLNALRRLEKICFPQDLWPLFDLVGVLTFPGVIRLKLVQQGEMAGFIAADVKRHEDLAWVSTLGILPEYRRRGLGSQLLRTCEDQLHVSRVRLSVRASNQPARQMYAKLGYVQYGVWKRYYSDGEDALVLEKTL